MNEEKLIRLNQVNSPRHNQGRSGNRTETTRKGV